MIAKIVIGVCCLDWLAASDSYGHLAARAAWNLVSQVGYKLFS